MTDTPQTRPRLLSGVSGSITKYTGLCCDIHTSQSAHCAPYTALTPVDLPGSLPCFTAVPSVSDLLLYPPIVADDIKSNTILHCSALNAANIALYRTNTPHTHSRLCADVPASQTNHTSEHSNCDIRSHLNACDHRASHTAFALVDPPGSLPCSTDVPSVSDLLLYPPHDADVIDCDAIEECTDQYSFSGDVFDANAAAPHGLEENSSSCGPASAFKPLLAEDINHHTHNSDAIGVLEAHVGGSSSQDVFLDMLVLRLPPSPSLTAARAHSPELELQTGMI